MIFKSLGGWKPEIPSSTGGPRALFLYISISSGHQRAAEAVMSALHQLNPRVGTAGVDCISYAFPLVGRLVTTMYLEMLEHTPQVWDYLYDNPTVEEVTRELRQLVQAFNKRKMSKLLKRIRPSCLVFTQAMPVHLFASLKQKGLINLPLVGIVTDFGVHQYWIAKEVDLYLVPTDEIKRDMVRRGVRENRVLVTGIPVDPGFSQVLDKTSERQRLGLDPRVPTALVMGGSKGLGPVEDIVWALRQRASRLQMIVVCGQNRRAYKKLRERFKQDPAVRLFGFTKQIPRLMDAADFLISKPGGLTCAEALVKGLPMVMVRPIPGQEERNARVLLKQGAAERADSLDELTDVVAQILQHKERLRRLGDRARALGRPEASFVAARAILKTMREPWSSVPLGHPERTRQEGDGGHRRPWLSQAVAAILDPAPPLPTA